MAEDVQDQIIFVMAVGDRRFTKSVPEGKGEQFFGDIVNDDSRWIAVDDGWILRDHVLHVYVSRSDREPLIL